MSVLVSVKPGAMIFISGNSPMVVIGLPLNVILAIMFPPCTIYGFSVRFTLCLMITWDIIKILTERFFPRKRTFQQIIFSDLSFLFSTLAVCFNEALQLKYTVVKDMIAYNNRNTFKQVIENPPDFEI